MYLFKRIATPTVFACFTIGLYLSSCKEYKKNSTHQDVPSASIEKGKELAAAYCQSCHMLPDPSLLDSKDWEKGVLPEMGPRLGIFIHNNQTYPYSRFDRSLPPGFYPSKATISDEDWQHIIDYYTALSPDSLQGQQRQKAIKSGLPLFTTASASFGYPMPATSYVKIVDSAKPSALIVSDVIKHTSFFLDRNLSLKDSVVTKGPIVHMDFTANQILATNIGILNPDNGKFGSAGFFASDANGKLRENPSHLFDSLQRPVQVTAADLNNDGNTDYVVCEFGFLTGGLYWMENQGNNKFVRHTLRPLPGAMKAYIQDYNHDGLPDIWVLFAQGEEGVFLYTNKGHGNFDQQEVLRFPPIYGSSYFELDDFNKDGYPDIVYTCGDNADYSVTLKPYHGVYIFLNDGKNNFKQRYFFPINGCYKAIARDFDGDGDLDIATISFFADYQRQPEEGFVYLENLGNFDFQPYSLQEAQKGRWLAMDAGDVDCDGKVDLVLGNFSIGPSMFKHVSDWKTAPPFLILKNTGKK